MFKILHIYTYYLTLLSPTVLLQLVNIPFSFDKRRIQQEVNYKFLNLFPCHFEDILYILILSMVPDAILDWHK
jgi:hypothetical protein